MNPPIVPFSEKQFNSIPIKISKAYKAGSHKGIDYAMPVGTPLMASQTGTISSVGKDQDGGYWLHVKGDDGRGYLYVHIDRDFLGTNYAGISKGGRKLPNVRVTQGQVVCWSGNTGKSTGPHLHYEVRSNASNTGSQINPGSIQVWSHKVGVEEPIENKKKYELDQFFTNDYPRPDVIKHGSDKWWNEWGWGEVPKAYRDRVQENIALKDSLQQTKAELENTKNILSIVEGSVKELESREINYIEQIRNLEKALHDKDIQADTESLIVKILKWVKQSKSN